MKKIPIVYVTNDNFADLCSVSIMSIIKNSSKKNIYEINVFYTRLSLKNINSYEKMSTSNVKVKCIDISKYVDFKDIYEIGRYPFEVFYRLYIPYVLKYKKIIYLDCDTIVIDDISKFYDETINTSIGCIMDYCYYMGGNKYFNSGVLIFNSKKYIDNNIKDKCLELIKNSKNKFLFPDQDILNIVCENDKTILSPKYNYQMHAVYLSEFRYVVEKKYKKLFDFKPLIIHYSYLTKPTYSIVSEYNNLFWEYAKETDYYDILLKKYLSNPYSVLKNSFLSSQYLNEVYDGNVGLKGILYVFTKSLKYWFIYKVRRGKNDKK